MFQFNKLGNVLQMEVIFNYQPSLSLCIMYELNSDIIYIVSIFITLRSAAGSVRESWPLGPLSVSSSRSMNSAFHNHNPLLQYGNNYFVLKQSRIFNFYQDK